MFANKGLLMTEGFYRTSFDLSKLKPEEIGIYVRCSRVDMESKTLNATEQVKAIRGWLDFQAFEDVPKGNEYVDVGDSRETFAKRKEWSRLDNDIMNGKVKAVLCYHLSRVIGNVREQAEMVEEFDELGVKIFSTTEQTEWTAKENRTHLHIKGALNENEVAELRRRIRWRMTALRTDGWFTGGPTPTGYTKIDVPGGHKSLEPLPEEHPDRKFLLDHYLFYASENSLAETAKRLYAVHGKKVSRNTVYNRLRSKIYTGKQPTNACTKDGCVRGSKKQRSRTADDICPVCGSATVEDDARWAGIVPQDLYDTCRELLNENRKRIRGRREAVYVLSSLLRDRVTGVRLTGHTTKTGGKEYQYYKVLVSHLKPDVRSMFAEVHDKKRSVKMDATEDKVLEQLQELSTDKSLLARAIAHYNKELTGEKQDSDERIRLSSRIETLTKQIERWTGKLEELFSNDSTDMEEFYTAQLTKCVREKKTAEHDLAELATVKRPIRAGLGNFGDFQTMLGNLVAVYKFAIINERRKLAAVLRSLIEVVEYDLKTGKVSIKWKQHVYTSAPTEPFLRNDEDDNNNNPNTSSNGSSSASNGSKSTKVGASRCSELASVTDASSGSLEQATYPQRATRCSIFLPVVSKPLGSHTTTKGRPPKRRWIKA